MVERRDIETVSRGVEAQLEAIEREKFLLLLAFNFKFPLSGFFFSE